METIDLDLYEDLGELKEFDEYDDLHWWEKDQEFEYSWELANGIYDPPCLF